MKQFPQQPHNFTRAAVDVCSFGHRLYQAWMWSFLPRGRKFSALELGGIWAGHRVPAPL